MGFRGTPWRARGSGKRGGRGLGCPSGHRAARAQGRAEAASVSWCGGFVWPFSGN